MSCASSNQLEGLLAETLPEAEARVLRDHLVWCSHCQAELDRLSDVPELRTWASADRPPFSAGHTLVGLYRQVCAADAPRTFSLDGTQELEPEPLRFLGPPTHEGDLGTLGPYRVLGELGRGGMGIVLRAYDPELRRPVALKVMRPERISALARTRFVREAQAAAAIEHEHVVPVYAVANPADGPPYLVMQYVEGPTLRAHIRASRRLAPREAASLAAQVADGLTAAHRAGLIHRDIKPSNILLSVVSCPLSVVREPSICSPRTTDHGPRTTVPKITDFGLARWADGAPGLTQEGIIAGTPEYMSPEQVRDAVPLDGRTDVYSLGVTLYEALTGEVPFRGAPPMVLEQILHDEPVPPRRLFDGIPRDLETICLKAMAKEPAKRYQTAAEFRDDLGRWLGGEPIRARPVGRRERLWRWCRRKPLVASLAASVAALLLVTAVGALAAAVREAHLASDALKARGEAEESARREQAARTEAEQLLERQYAGNAVRLLEEGDPLGAVPWVAECLRLAKGDPAREEMHRYRFAALRRQCPRVVHAWFHEGLVRYAEFSRDGRIVVTASHDKTARVWNAATGEPVTPPLLHPNEVRRACFSPDSRRVLTACHDGKIRFWDAATGAPAGPDLVLPPGSTAAWAAFSPDGQRVLDYGWDLGARLWDLSSPKPTHKFLNHGAAITCAAFSPDGRFAVTGGKDKMALVWDAVTGEVVTRVAHGSELAHAAFSPDGKRLLTGCVGAVACLWDVAEPGQPILKHLLRHLQIVNRVAFSPDGGRLLTASADAWANIWDAKTGRVLRSFRHGGPLSQAAFSPDGGRIVTASADRTVQVWYAGTGSRAGPPMKLGGAPYLAAFSPDSRRVLTSGEEGAVRLWDWKPVTPAALVLEHRALVRRAVFSADGRRIATASFDDTAQVWDADSGSRVGEPMQHGADVLHVAFSPDGRHVLTTSRDCTARVWVADTGGAVTPPLEHQAEVLHAAFSADGRWVATAALDGKARVWDTATGQPLTEWLIHPSRVGPAAFSPDGRLVALASGDGRAYLWEIATSRQAGPPLRPGEGLLGVSSVMFSSDGRHLLTGGDGACLWDVATGVLVVPPMRHNAGVRHAAFSPDGRRIVTCSVDQSARVWDAATGEPITPPMKHTGDIEYVAFSPDGRRVVTACSMTSTARVWDAATGLPLTPFLHQPDTVWDASFSPDGRRVLIACGDGKARLFEIPFEDRPVSDLLQMAQALTGSEFRASGTFVPLAPERFRADWSDLAAKYPREFPRRAATP